MTDLHFRTLTFCRISVLQGFFESFGSGQQWTTITGKLFYPLTPLKQMLSNQADKGGKIKEHVYLPTFHIVMVQFIELQADFA